MLPQNTLGVDDKTVFEFCRSFLSLNQRNPHLSMTKLLCAQRGVYFSDVFHLQRVLGSFIRRFRERSLVWARALPCLKSCP